MGSKRISSQQEWSQIVGQFANSSDYRTFRERFFFDEQARIRRTGLQVNEAISPRAVKRRRIFEECLLDGRRVKDVNFCACNSKLGGEHDADIYIALFTG